jgi:hypothetical protein
MQRFKSAETAQRFTLSKPGDEAAAASSLPLQ